MFKAILDFFTKKSDDCVMCNKPGEPGAPGHEECLWQWAIK